MNISFFHLIIYTPINSADAIRKALLKAGAGKIGNYDSCSFSSKGIGRFRPNKKAKPFLGSANVIEEVEEERIEVIVPADKIKDVLIAAIEVHPYEEPAIHVLPMFDYHQLIN